jgi:hypothetical protein
VTRVSNSFILAIVVGAGIAAYAWWTAPERQIRRVLANIAEHVSHDRPLQGLAAASAAAGLQRHFAADVVIEAGRPFGLMKGRDAVTAAAARILMAMPAMRLEFVDTTISVAPDGQSATVDCTAMATIRDRAGQESVDAREVVMTMSLADGSWVIHMVKTVDVLEPVS